MAKSKARKAGISNTKKPWKIARTAKRKIKNLLKMLSKTTSERAKTYFNERINFWKSK